MVSDSLPYPLVSQSNLRQILFNLPRDQLVSLVMHWLQSGGVDHQAVSRSLAGFAFGPGSNTSRSTSDSIASFRQLLRFGNGSNIRHQESSGSSGEDTVTEQTQRRHRLRTLTRKHIRVYKSRVMNCRCQLNLAEMKMYEQHTSDIADKAVRLVVEEVRVGSEAIDHERRFGSWVKGFDALTDLLRLTLERQTIREVECSREGEAGEKIVEGIRTLSSALSKFDRYDSRANTIKGLLIGATNMCEEFREIEVETFKPNLNKVRRTMQEWRDRRPVVTCPSTSSDVSGYQLEVADSQGPVDCPGISFSVEYQVEVDVNHGQLVAHENSVLSEGQAGVDQAILMPVDTPALEVRSEDQAEVAHADQDRVEAEAVEAQSEKQAGNDNANQGHVAVHTAELQSEIEVEVGNSAQGQVGGPEPIDRPEDRFGNPGQGPVSTQEFNAHCGIQSEILNEDQEVLVQEIDMESEEQLGVSDRSSEPGTQRVYIEQVDEAEWWRCQLILEDMLAYEEECWKAEIRREIELDFILYDMERIEEARLDADMEYYLEEENREELMAEAKNDVWLEDFVDEGIMGVLKAEAEYDMKMEAY